MREAVEEQAKTARVLYWFAEMDHPRLDLENAVALVLLFPHATSIDVVSREQARAMMWKEHERHGLKALSCLPVLPDHLAALIFDLDGSITPLQVPWHPKA